jgi:hypothetical protein
MKRGLLITLLACSHGGDHDTLAGVPKAAAEALRREAGGHAIEKVDREADGTFEAAWLVDGQKHEATVDANGKVIETEIEVTADQVPAAVRATAEAQLGKAIQYVRLGTGNYEAEAGKREVLIDPSGKLLPADKDEDTGQDDGD